MCGETLGDLEPVYDLFPITSEFVLPEVVTQTCMWQLCGAGRFSYGESPRTPPLEETPLHRRNMSVERPLGILSLFTTCFRLRVKSLARGGDTDIYVCGIFVKSLAVGRSMHDYILTYSRP